MTPSPRIALSKPSASPPGGRAQSSPVPDGRPDGALDDDESAPRIGPNSVIQTYRALEALEGPQAREAVEARAALPPVGLDGLIPEAWFVRAVDATRAVLPPERAEAVLSRAGTLTAAYVREHRIPRVFAALLRVLPSRLAVPLLLAAFRRHAWTFAGAGRYRALGPYPGVIELEGAPTCRGRFGRASGPTGAYYAAAFEGLLALAEPALRVQEVACEATGSDRCRFELTRREPSPGPAERQTERKARPST